MICRPAWRSANEQIVGQSILGSEPFVSWVRGTYIDREKDRERPDIGKIHHYLSMEAVVAVVEKVLGITHLLQTAGTDRQMIMAALYNYAGLNNREIGELLGVDYSTVSQGRKRLRTKIEKNPRTKLLFQKIDKELSRIKI